MTGGKFLPRAYLKMAICAAILILWGAGGSGPLHAEVPVMQWEHVYPHPTGSWLNAAAWGPPGFVVVGADGEILFSTDAVQWERITINGTKEFWFQAVCYHNGKYVAVGNGNLIVASTNGQDWLIANPGTNGLLRACAGDAGTYAAVGLDKTLLVSTTGIDWQQRITPAEFSDIVFGNNTWVALTGGSTVYTSSDLENWTSVEVGSFGAPVLTSICFGEGQFIVGGAWQPGGLSGTVIETSTNGLNWASVSLNGLDAFGETRDLVFAAGTFVAVQADYFLLSTNGTAWEKIPAPDAGGDLRGIGASAGGQFVAVGSIGAMLMSDDAELWQVISIEPRLEVNSVAYANGRFVAAGGFPSYIGGPSGSGAVLSSTNGHDWQVALTDLEDQLSALAYGNGVWVVTGDDGGIFTSSNGVDWADHSLSSTSRDLHLLAYGNGRFVAFAIFRDVVYHSTNGMDWVSADAPLASEIAKVRFLNGRFMGVGGDDHGTIFFSMNGVTWEKITLNGTGWLAGMAYGKGRYVAIGRDVSAVSFDGIGWTVSPVSILIDDLQYVDGWFVGIGPRGMLVSRDGVEWQTMDQPVLNDNRLSILAYGAGTLLAGGGMNLYRGTLQDTEAFKKRLHLLHPSQLEFYGETGYDYRVEQSTNLTDWLPVSAWSAGSDQYLIWDLGPFDEPESFWRAAGRANPELFRLWQNPLQ